MRPFFALCLAALSAIPFVAAQGILERDATGAIGVLNNCTFSVSLISETPDGTSIRTTTLTTGEEYDETFDDEYRRRVTISLFKIQDDGSLSSGYVSLKYKVNSTTVSYTLDAKNGDQFAGYYCSFSALDNDSCEDLVWYGGVSATAQSGSCSSNTTFLMDLGPLLITNDIPDLGEPAEPTPTN